MLSLRHAPTRRPLVLLTLAASVLALATQTTPASAAPAPSYSLQVSAQADRAAPQPLAGKSYTQSTTLYVFATPTTSVKRVRFYLDDPSMTAAPRSIDSAAPYDYAGTATDGKANPLNTSTLTAGNHTITAAVETTTAKTRVISSSFTITTPPPAADTTKPTSPTLTLQPGENQITLNWTASTDNVGVTKYEVWKDDNWLLQLPTSSLTHTVTGLNPDNTYSFRVVAYDAAGNFNNSLTVSAQPTRSAPAGGSPAPFPSRLRANGRTIADENGYVLPTLRGFNMHVSPGFAWDQSHFDAIRTLGGKINRAVLHWDHFEPSQGAVSSTAIASLDQHIARAQAAGIYTLLELHLNVGRSPSWTSAHTTEMEKYSAYGQTLTQYLAYRYGNPASSKYTKAVVGFGLNEPPLEDSTIRNGNGSIPYLEGKQRQMIQWMRAPGFAGDWIGFVAYGYASATPIYNDATQNPNAVDASPTAYSTVGGNVVIDVHDYAIGCTNSDVNCEGRQWNGMVYPTYQGGPLQTTAETTSYTSTALRQSQHAAFLRPYKTFSQQAGIPLMLGEWGWSNGHTGESAYIADSKALWTDAGTAIQISWNYDTSTSNSVWAARPGGAWRPSVTSLFAP